MTSHRYTSAVREEDLRTLAAEVDPTAPGTGHHLNFDQILRRCGHAWMDLLTGTGVFGTGIICPRVEVDYHREVGAGPLDVDVVVLSVGRTSFVLRLDVQQHEQLCARAVVTLVAFDYDARRPHPLDADQRAALGRHLLDPAT